MQPIWRKVAAAAASAATLVALVAGCGGGPSTSNNASGGQTTSEQKPIEGGSVTLDALQNIRDLDPAFAYDTQSYEVVTELYDQLVTWKGDTTDIIPMAAQDYTVSPDGLTYTFHIRKGMTFWNGDSVTAQSFIDELYRVLSPTLQSPGQSFYEIIQGADAYAAGKAKTISGLQAPDPYTLVIKLSKPEAFFIQILTMPFASAVDTKFIQSVGNHEVYKKNPAFDSNQAMGSGPFKLQSINQNQIVLVKNTNYWRTDQYGQKLPYLDKVTINVNGNDQIDAMHFEQGQTAWIAWNMGGIPSSAYPKFMSDPNLKKLTVTAVQNSVQYVGMNTKTGPTAKPLVRQAIEYAIDKQAVLKLNNGRGQIANQPLPPGVVGYVKNLDPSVQYTYDPNKAKQLLAQAGYPNGFTIDFYSQNSPDQLKFDQAIQQQLAQVGIKVNLHTSSWATFLDVAEAGKAPMFWLAWIQDFPDASDFLNTLFNSNQAPQNNMTLYSNPQVDAWLNKAQYDPNQDERNQLYAQVTNQIMKDAPWVPMWYDTFTAAVQPWVHGFYIPKATTDRYEFIWVDPGHNS